MSSYSDDDDDVVEIVRPHEDVDYIEISSRRGDKGPPPKTKEIPPIPKEKLTHFKDLYEKQPQRIKELLRVKFYEGKPVIDPPPLESFVNRVRNLQEKKKSRKKEQKKKLREELKRLKGKDTSGSSSTAKEVKVNEVEVEEKDLHLVHVEYPGRVVNVDKAVETMGGIGTLSGVFDDFNKKLHVRFRPDDPWCNSVKGEPAPVTGVLLRVRYPKPKQRVPAPSTSSSTRKSASKSKGKKVSTVTGTTGASASGNAQEGTILVNGIPMTKAQILFEDSELMKKNARQSDDTLRHFSKTEAVTNSFLKIPQNYNPVPDENIKIELLGIANKTYKFDGLCDFQYLPMKMTKRGMVSTRDKLFPVVGIPSEDNDKLFVCEELLDGSDGETHVDFLPATMSRVDKPTEVVVEHTVDADNAKLTTDLKKKSGVISTIRARRNVYTIFYNFQPEKASANTAVPTEPLEGAVDDIKKRPHYEKVVDKIKQFFEQKPVWSKVALEYESKQTSLALKYVLPYVSYFATSGPWRALWIKFGYDPREHKNSYLYQSFDFRVPVLYKQYMADPEILDESFYVFRPNTLPPRVQMLYQLCHIHCEEVDRLISIATEKAEKNELVYDMRYGWLKEGTYDYLRYVIIGYMEALLEEQGKIPSRPQAQKIFLQDGQLEVENLTPRPRQVKRIRKVKYKPKLGGTEHSISTSTRASPRAKSKHKKNKGKESSKWAYQGILEDINLKEFNRHRSNNEDDNEILEDDSLLSDEDFETEEDSDDEDYDPTPKPSTSKR